MSNIGGGARATPAPQAPTPLHILLSRAPATRSVNVAPLASPRLVVQLNNVIN